MPQFEENLMIVIYDRKIFIAQATEPTHWDHKVLHRGLFSLSNTNLPEKHARDKRSCLLAMELVVDKEA